MSQVNHHIQLREVSTTPHAGTHKSPIDRITGSLVVMASLLKEFSTVPNNRPERPCRNLANKGPLTVPSRQCRTRFQSKIRAFVPMLAHCYDAMYLLCNRLASEVNHFTVSLLERTEPCGMRIGYHSIRVHSSIPSTRVLGRRS
jgi:hypothetical protein